jgi:hypothetical protein
MVNDPVDLPPRLSAGIRRLVAQRYRARLMRVQFEANPYESRHRSGVATCWFEGDERIQLFWKLGPTRSWEGIGRIGGTGYELGAYEAIERIGGAPAPRLIGGARIASKTLLVTDYVAEALRVHKNPGPRALERAAMRIGEFHRRARTVTPSQSLVRYSPRTFARFANAACRTEPQARWLTDVARTFPDRAAALQATGLTVVHGEFYPDNVLTSAAETTAVDWEWAGVAMGEIDLAALTEGPWDPRVIARCTRAYADARRLRPGDRLFGQRLAAARLYFHLRWLATPARQRTAPATRWRLRDARRLATDLDLISSRSRS